MRSIVAFLFVLCCAMQAAYADAPNVDKPIAIMRALDKVTARVEEIDVQVGKPYKFGTIFITVDACRVTPPEVTPESAAFLEVSEFKAGEQEQSVFKGWMFASSPALSAMEHPVYDLWLMGCKDAQTQTTAVQPPSPAPTK